MPIGVPSAQKSNYVKIESAVANLITANLGITCELGDFSKLTEATPLMVIRHGDYYGPLTDRRPNIERMEWTLCLDLMFDYTSDAEAHALYRAYRVDLVNLFMLHRWLDDGNTPYPAGLNGQCLDSKIVGGKRPQYPTIDGKTYVMAEYDLWVAEQLIVTYV
jgi:hypothetical protein